VHGEQHLTGYWNVFTKAAGDYLLLETVTPSKQHQGRML
jgi:hypothetical protein